MSPRRIGYKVADRNLRNSRTPESLVSSYGYDPQLSEGALVPPIFLSSTFVFPSAEEAERSFQLAYHLRKTRSKRASSLIYTRLNNPDWEILEERLTLFEHGAESAAVFSSGMAAIATSILSLVGAGESVLYSTPVYGGTDYLFVHILPRLGIRTVPFCAGLDGKGLRKLLRDTGESGGRPAMVFLETPANPTCTLSDIKETADIVKEYPRAAGGSLLLCVDNTFLGPLWQHPAELGADMVVYSATKFLGGHSDVVAGAVLGRKDLIEDHVKTYRTILGSVLSPFDGYLLLRSLETLTMRMSVQMRNAQRVADWLKNHPMVEKVNYPGLLGRGTRQRRIYDRQCKGPGSMISFYIHGGKKEAFRFLNSLKMVKLAVSLGSTKTLAEHPATMTHSDLDPEERKMLGIDDRMIRLSVGTESHTDIISDISEAFSNLRHKVDGRPRR